MTEWANYEHIHRRNSCKGFSSQPTMGSAYLLFVVAAMSPNDSKDVEFHSPSRCQTSYYEQVYYPNPLTILGRGWGKGAEIIYFLLIL